MILHIIHCSSAVHIHVNMIVVTFDLLIHHGSIVLSVPVISLIVDV